MSKFKITWTEKLTYETEVQANSTCEAFEEWLKVDKKKLDHKKLEDKILGIECLDEEN